jgi:hypothetical protein
MRKTLTIVVTVTIIAIILCAGLLLSSRPPAESGNPKAFVGVTYCGDTVEGGKLLIDKVKGYSNLFVLQSGLLQRDLASVDELGDYAVASGMYFLPYFGNFIQSTFSTWLENAKQKWGTHFLGIYYADEPGGKMLDSYVEYNDAATGNSIYKTKYGDVVVQKQNGVIINYELGGTIRLYEPPPANSNSDINSEAVFYPNGTIEIVNPNVDGFSYESYQELVAVKPFKDSNETAQRFNQRDRNNIEFLRNYTTVFTSDYGLYYFDYSSGYDVVLGHIGWNLTYNQQIALMRGAAHQQNKDWGIIITWKYQNPPYLDNKTVILDQLTTAYQCGAKYFVLFNYSDSNNGTYGTMQPEHFEALETFWKDVVNNPEVVQCSIRADSAVVFPVNYGWGTRWDGDKVWGIFNADEQTGQLWRTMQQALQERGLKIDFIFGDADAQFLASYQHIYRPNNQD